MTLQPAETDFAHVGEGVAGMGAKETAAQSCAAYCLGEGYVYMGLSWTNVSASI
jgi:hypothetical protein